MRKVSVWIGKSYTIGIQMFNEQGVSLLDIGDKYCDKFDVELADGERIVGVHSRLYSKSTPTHCNLTFIIGRLE